MLSPSNQSVKSCQQVWGIPKHPYLPYHPHLCLRSHPSFKTSKKTGKKKMGPSLLMPMTSFKTQMTHTQPRTLSQLTFAFDLLFCTSLVLSRYEAVFTIPSL